MKTTILNLIRQPCIRQFHSTTRRKLPIAQPIRLVPQNLTDVQSFRDNAFKPQKPFLFARDAGSASTQLKAASKWFHQVGTHDAAENSRWTFSQYMNQFQHLPFPYELVTLTAANRQALLNFHDWLLSGEELADQLLAEVIESSLRDLGSHTFCQLFAPLRLLMKALEFNRAQWQGNEPEYLSLYIAQSSLSELPQELLDDLTTPHLVQHAGKGDVYSSSVWLGTEPTYTPLHRDPNPNLFCQLCNTKLIRLLRPALGDRLFWEVQKRIRQQANSRIRTVEMMEGKEREVLQEAVWMSHDLPDEMYEAELGPGDSLFIPNGWWHSVKSKGTQGQLNASVNWWFR